ncbi:hypothetical protein [Nesterenkonia pannonica]|uniref:hypothetical protein n=1 Tax=Nesterenkonia pannonica TaxID=1548602 RepID=UPI0021645072|nr:hypothetical protein [Nesterenkonia pannonica]
MSADVPGRLRGVPELVAAARAQENEHRASAEKITHLLAFRERIWNDAEAAAEAAGVQGAELEARLEAADDGVARDIEAALGPRGYGEPLRNPEVTILQALDAAEWVREENPNAWAEFAAGRTDLAWVRRTFEKSRAPLPASADPRLWPRRRRRLRRWRRSSWLAGTAGSAAACCSSRWETHGAGKLLPSRPMSRRSPAAPPVPRS